MVPRKGAEQMLLKNEEKYVIPTLGRLRQEDHKFGATLDCVRNVSKNTNLNLKRMKRVHDSGYMVHGTM
jgi:hypothetical protein